ncbi:MAG TPA: exodeoxyribonuclease VII large subunit [Mycobacteriales bacterium]|nr:exodeoxyribonuclease VII large subunit [Mycobacteriales bacterium]
MPPQTTAESPVQVRNLAQALLNAVAKVGRVWVEGQITEVRRRGATAYFTLRDTSVEMSVPASCSARLIDDLEPPLTEGARVVVWGEPQYWAKRGSLSFSASDVRPVGIGALLARIEALRGVLAAEGLFAAERKRPLPFLPKRIGLITGRASDAERDVVDNATRRWPAVQFRIEAAAVQGPYAVTEIIDALGRLDADPEVDVIVIARGGGSMEDLLPFSDEALVRAVAAAFTPVVSAIGHEANAPLLDHVADVRASTPTDAAKRIVPDFTEESERIQTLLARARRCVAQRVDTERHRLESMLSRPSISDPYGVIAGWHAIVDDLRERADRAALSLLTQHQAELAGLRGQVTALSPQGTLDRGYAVVQRADGSVVRDASAVGEGEALTARVAAGTLHLVTEAMSSAGEAGSASGRGAGRRT